MSYDPDEAISIINMIVEDGLENQVNVTEDVAQVLCDTEFIDKNRFQDDA